MQEYRSKIDELVCKSGIPGSTIAREMGITVNRIIALRRCVNTSISSDDVASCEAAIERLGGHLESREESRLSELKYHLNEIKSILSEGDSDG